MVTNSLPQLISSVPSATPIHAPIVATAYADAITMVVDGSGSKCAAVSSPPATVAISTSSHTRTPLMANRNTVSTISSHQQQQHAAAHSNSLATGSLPSGALQHFAAANRLGSSQPGSQSASSLLNPLFAFSHFDLASQTALSATTWAQFGAVRAGATVGTGSNTGFPHHPSFHRGYFPGILPHHQQNNDLTSPAWAAHLNSLASIFNTTATSSATGGSNASINNSIRSAVTSPVDMDMKNSDKVRDYRSQTSNPSPADSPEPIPLINRTGTPSAFRRASAIRPLVPSETR